MLLPSPSVALSSLTFWIGRALQTKIAYKTEKFYYDWANNNFKKLN